jgi:hypothetical protein
LEHELGRTSEAAAVYAELAAAAVDDGEAARALRALARCLAKSGRPDAALDVLAVQLQDERYRAAVDEAGRLVQPDALLMALELMGGADQPRFGPTSRVLHGRLTDYGEPAMSPSQRRFLMRRLAALAPDGAPFPTLDAEELAAEYLEDGAVRVAPGSLVRSHLPGVWLMAAPGRRAVGLFREEGIVRDALAGGAASPPGTHVALLQPEQEAATPFLTARAGPPLAEWRFALYLDGPDPFGAAARRQVAVYVWAGCLAIGGCAIFVLLVGRYVLRQIRLTRLKNDFIGAVSHELKTPLSAMRVIVDTLLADDCRDRERAVEYMELARKENERLSRLIDNFLSFSRMERDARAFAFEPLDPAEIARTAAEHMRAGLESAGFAFHVDVQPGLPTVAGDRDALVTALLNLLDNARKYSADEKDIRLRAYGVDRSVCFEVADKGIGMTRRDARKAFDRFYQADRALSRSTGGCGLGLSIVRFIARGHGGSVRVRSRPGEGSTFKITLPVNGDPERQTSRGASDHAE